MQQWYSVISFWIDTPGANDNKSRREIREHEMVRLIINNYVNLCADRTIQQYLSAIPRWGAAAWIWSGRRACRGLSGQKLSRGYLFSSVCPGITESGGKRQTQFLPDQGVCQLLELSGSGKLHLELSRSARGSDPDQGPLCIWSKPGISRRQQRLIIPTHRINSNSHG